MQMISRSYSVSTSFRPRPYVLERPESGIIIVITIWSGDQSAEKLARQVLEQVESLGVNDSTQVRELDLSVGESATDLKSCLEVLARSIFVEHNQKIATTMVEALVLRSRKGELSWAQVGQPNLYLLRKKRVVTLCAQTDYGCLDPQLAPLPSQGVGLQSSTSIFAGATRIQSGDQLVCLSHSWGFLFRPIENVVKFEDLTASLIESDPQQPFWCGLVHL